MINKTLSNGVKVLRISTWLSAIFSLLVVIVVGFFVAFPGLIKGPIESQLSTTTGLNVELSKLNFELDRGGISLKIHEMALSSKELQRPIASIQNLQWKVQLFSLLDDIYRPNHVAIDLLTINANGQAKGVAFSVNEMKQLVAKDTLAAANFFELLTINKTVIKAEQDIELSPIVVSHNQGQLVLSVADQTINNHQVDIKMVLSSDQLSHDGFITLPMTISNQDFSLLSNIKLYQKEGHTYTEFLGHVEQINATDLADYIPAAVVGQSTNSWMRRGFKSGVLQNSNIRILKNISEDQPAEINFTAYLSNTELLFNSDWQTLKDLEANITTDGKNIKVLVNQTKLYDFPLSNIELEIADMSQPNLDVHMQGKINTNSQDFIQFLADAPSGSTVHDTIKQFSLIGPLKGELDLIIPLDNRKSTLDIDLTIRNNHLTTLDGAIVVNNYDSKIAFHDNIITTKGVGDIRNIPFEIRINPGNRKDDKESSFAVELINNNGFELYLTKRLDETWRARVESEALKTNIEIALTNDLPSVRILSLQATTFDSLKGNWDIEPNDFPSMYLSTHGVFIDEKVMPNFSAKLESTNNALLISNLLLNGVGVDQQDLRFNGAWVAGKTILTAKAKGDALSDFLDKMKINEKVDGGKFDFDVRIFCDCAPWNMNLKDASGIANMNIQQGVFTDKDPNLGRILSLLNIKSVAKRLKLDVSDLTDKGFVYDSIDAKITLQNSQAKIDRFQLEASSSAISLTGLSDIMNQTYDLEAKVIPAIGDAVPVATYLAGGGLAGLGVWLADQGLFDGKLIDQIIDQVVEFKYKIIGPWDDPVITNISKIL
ncbi:DUF3971 domain-containing protein [Candidatus Thioglobus sp.]|uniref:YhdP family protein n=1 Tax=Candidatus Thioglobus sp. TaxID=2026721 RepID=UPI00262D8374|nr:DUF3971 domain-containing protein [Candidatus Thioglobus sp.]MDG2395791.1 DUF3971 domain-containing protein [Candidatus Thioglobus sp.]